jgi:hypothetical protein
MSAEEVRSLLSRDILCPALFLVKPRMRLPLSSHETSLGSQPRLNLGNFGIAKLT